ncbi:hypothetical protein [Acinetobacter sp. YH12075]|uniref:hypothetical protein n=1 Tax=Acinetobacter sp. YH12075 TaxID=2601070 RepID=UPI0015D3F830|nr:hypothetical protein [Acinetobacter sp. YH12075]
MENSFIFEDAVNIFINLLEDNNPNLLMNGQIKKICLDLFLEYALIATKSDFESVYINDLFHHTGTIKDSKDLGRMRKDLFKISKLLNDALILIHTTYGGQELLKHPSKAVSEISKLSALAEEKATTLIPQKGRNKSKERTARLDMLAVLLTIFMEYCPNVKKTSFNNTLEEIYSILNIPVNELSRDINESRQLFLNNKNYYKTQFLHSIRT